MQSQKINTQNKKISKEDTEKTNKENFDCWKCLACYVKKKIERWKAARTCK